MRKQLIGVAAGICLVAAAVAVVGGRKPAVVHAQQGCDATTLTGAYAYTLNGTVYDNQGYIYYLGAVGHVVSDGNGNLTGADSMSFDGQILKRQVTGTYTLNADCTGSATLTASNGSMGFDLVAIDKAKEVQLVQTDTAFILTGSMKQQFPASAATTTTPVAQ